MSTAQLLPTMADVRDLVTEALAARAASAPDVVEGEDALWMRGLLPTSVEVRRGDRVRGGVAVHITGADVFVHPYVVREVCSCGAIMSELRRGRHLERVTERAGAAAQGSVIHELRHAVASCIDSEAFAESVAEMRTALAVRADLMLELLSGLRPFPPRQRDHLMQEVLARFAAEHDHSMFGLMSAVSNLARDATDPEMRWRLESLAGAMVARASRRPPTSPVVPMRAVSEGKPDPR